jgi:hypothetical protein
MLKQSLEWSEELQKREAVVERNFVVLKSHIFPLKVGVAVSDTRNLR